MITIERTKLGEGGTYVELRSYEIEKAISRKESIKITHGDEFMILTWRQLKSGKVVNTQRSKYYPYKTYLMLKYKWEPYRDIDLQPAINLDVKKRLSQIWRDVIARKNL